MFFFEIFLPMSLTGSVLIAAIVLIRPLLKRWQTHGVLLVLWFAACAMLLLPFRFTSPVSVYNAVGGLPVIKDVFTVGASAGHGNVAMLASMGQTDAGAGFLRILPVLPGIWLVGVCVALIFVIISALMLTRRFRDAVYRADLSAFVGNKARVYISSRTVGPLTYGVFRPCIILPLSADEMDEDALEYMLLHELQHIRSRDALVNLLWVLSLCLHWFNPVVWQGWLILRRDMEMRIDAKVLEQVGAQHRTGYAQTLLNVVPVKHALPLAFGSSSARDRIKGILVYRPATKGAVCISLVVVFFCMAMFAANPARTFGGITFAVTIVSAAPQPNDTDIVLFKVNSSANMRNGLHTTGYVYSGSFACYTEVQRHFIGNYFVDAAAVKIYVVPESGHAIEYGFGVDGKTFALQGMSISVEQRDGPVNYILVDASTFSSEDFDFAEAVNILISRMWSFHNYHGGNEYRIVFEGR